MMADGSQLSHTALHQAHCRLGARMIGFGGWEMPLYYKGIVEEHQAVREKVGLFDVSHMGEIEIEGGNAAALCQRLTTNDVNRLSDGSVQYTLLCDENGGVIDDVTLYRRSQKSYFFCVNAANTAKDYAWIASQAKGVSVRDISRDTALLSLQGPLAAVTLARLSEVVPGDLARFSFTASEVAGVAAIVSRTGYTGEDGFEVFLPNAGVVAVWEAILEEGREAGLVPIGLGARDTLRLEAALPLYGNELSASGTPLEAGLNRFVRLDAGDFVGAAALIRQQNDGLSRRLVGIELVDEGIARAGYEILAQGKVCGQVTSGTKSPTLGKSIALAYVNAHCAELGTELEVLIRGRRAKARIVRLPFYRRQRRI